MSILSKQDQELKDKGDKIIWKWLARRQEPYLEQFEQLLKDKPVTQDLVGLKCTHCGEHTTRLIITKKTLAEIDENRVDYIMAREMHTYTDAAEIYCPKCFNRSPCDMHYQVSK